MLGLGCSHKRTLQVKRKKKKVTFVFNKCSECLCLINARSGYRECVLKLPGLYAELKAVGEGTQDDGR